MNSSQHEDNEPKGMKLRQRQKISEDKENEVYCFCREPHDNRFMIACDGCKEWYHGDCVQISRTTGRSIDVYYCPLCSSQNSNLKTIYFGNSVKEKKKEPIPQRCTECVNCLSKPDCGECSRCISKCGRCLAVKCLTYVSEPITEEKEAVTEKKEVDVKRNSIRTTRSEVREIKEEEEEKSGGSPPRMAAGGGVVPPSKKATGGKPRRAKSVRGKAGDAGSDDDLEQYVPQEHRQQDTKIQPMQCLGRECTCSARANSKYCSEECGLALARDRINRYLVPGVENYWGAEPVAVKLIREAVEIERAELEQLRSEKTTLDKWCGLMNVYINAAKQLEPVKEEQKEDDEAAKKGDAEFMIACTVCTVDYGSEVIARHTERCLAKLEKKTTFGTKQKYARNPDNIFCETFSKEDGSYCKRLRVTCPDHYREGELEEGLRVCGWPWVWSAPGGSTMENVFLDLEELIKHSMCAVSRKDCRKHSGWITTILGQIDARRLACVLRMDYLAERAAARPKIGDALLMMANRTDYHQPPEQIIERYKSEAEKSGSARPRTVL